jgi:hypothetical protein
MKKQKANPFKQKILADLKRGVREINLIKAGKKKGVLLKDFLSTF